MYVVIDRFLSNENIQFKLIADVFLCKEPSVLQKQHLRVTFTVAMPSEMLKNIP